MRKKKGQVKLACLAAERMERRREQSSIGQYKNIRRFKREIYKDRQTEETHKNTMCLKGAVCNSS